MTLIRNGEFSIPSPYNGFQGDLQEDDEAMFFEQFFDSCSAHLTESSYIDLAPAFSATLHSGDDYVLDNTLNLSLFSSEEEKGHETRKVIASSEEENASPSVALSCSKISREIKPSPILVPLPTGPGISKKRTGRKRKSRAKGPPQPSKTCHVCTRNGKTYRLLGCKNLATRMCKKVVCNRCASKYDITSALHAFEGQAEASEWECMHCTGATCPGEAQCHWYGKANEARAAKRHAARTASQEQRR